MHLSWKKITIYFFDKLLRLSHNMWEMCRAQSHYLTQLPSRWRYTSLSAITSVASIWRTYIWSFKMDVKSQNTWIWFMYFILFNFSYLVLSYFRHQRQVESTTKFYNSVFTPRIWLLVKSYKRLFQKNWGGTTGQGGDCLYRSVS